MSKLILVPRRPARPPGILVQAVVRLDGDTYWIPAGTAAPTSDACGRRLLCVRFEAIPADRRLYLPLQDVLVLAGDPGDTDPLEGEQSGPIHSCGALP